MKTIEEKNKDNNETIKISIENFQNIWADHKRNDLNYLEVFSKEDSILPEKINIKFKGSIFSLIKN